jgi:hypothetical protein
LKLPNAALHLKEVLAVFKEKNVGQLIFPSEFMAQTGLTRSQASLLFADLGFEANPFVEAVTVPQAEGKIFSALRKKGLIEDPSEFQIDSELGDESIPPNQIQLLVAYEICHE